MATKTKKLPRSQRQLNNPRKQARREKAEARKGISSVRTPEERLALLDQAFGPGKGAARERAKLLALMAKPEPKKEKKAKEDKP